MTLRTKSLRGQLFAWTVITAVALVAYVVIDLAFGLGAVWQFTRSTQMRVFLPTAIVAGMLMYEFRRIPPPSQERFHFMRRKQAKPVVLVEPSESETSASSASLPLLQPENAVGLSGNRDEITDAITIPPFLRRKEPKLTPEEMWTRACAIPHSYVLRPKVDDEYYRLLGQAAEAGHPQALDKMSDHALRRKMIVEAYFWMALSEHYGNKAAHRKLQEIRRLWIAKGMPTERRNVSTFFTDERGLLARALIRRDCGVDTIHARLRIRELIAAGNPEALLLGLDARQSLRRVR